MPPARTLTLEGELFGSIIQRLRVNRGWNLIKFAQRSGMSRYYLGLLERGQNTPSFATLFELADVFGVKASDIIREIENARPAPEPDKTLPGPGPGEFVPPQ